MLDGAVPLDNDDKFYGAYPRSMNKKDGFKGYPILIHEV